MDTKDQSLLDRALYLLEAGFHVFPLGGYGETPPDYFIRERFNGDVEKARAAWPKQPRISWKPFQSAPPSEEQVRHWFLMWPNANIGIATGKLVVVDADNLESAAWVKATLTPTPWRVKTGKGYHFYYAANPNLEIRNSADPLAKIDTRGVGGYVVAAGSRHSSGNFYVDEIAADVGAVALCDLPTLHPADVEAIKGYRHDNLQAASAAQPRQTQGNLVGFDARRYALPATGEAVGEGGRNVAAASLAGQYIRQDLPLREIKQLMDSWNSTNTPPLSDTELSTTVASVVSTHNRNHPHAPVMIEREAPAPVTAIRKRKVNVFPVHLLDVPGLVGDVARYITKTAIKPQPVLSLAASLTLCGTLMGRKVRTRSDLRTNLYAICVAPSGAGKEHPRKAIKLLLKEAGGLSLIGAEQLASDAGLFAALLNSPSCILLMDEIGRTFRLINNPRAPAHLAEIVSFLMRLTSIADSDLLEKKRAEHATAPARVIQQPNLCLLGTTVPGRLYESLTPKDIEDGFLPRMPIFHSDTPDPEEQQPIDKTPEPELIRAIEMWIARPVNAYAKGNLDLKPNPLYVDTSPSAALKFEEFDAANRVRKAQTRGTGVDAMWARAKEHAMRMALIRACGRDFDHPVIQGDDAAWACELVAFLFDRSIAEIDVNVAEIEHESTLKKVLNFVTEKGRVQRHELLRKFRSVKAQAMNEILSTLQQTDEISSVVEKTNGHGRPPLWIVWSGNERKQ